MQPPAGRAEFGAVDGLVSRIGSVQMKSIVPDAADVKKYGLDKPAATVRLGSGSSQATLAIGGPAETGSVYAKDLSRPAVFTIESSLLDDLKKEPLTRAVALALLKAARGEITPVTIQELGRMHGLEILHGDAVEIGDTLVIHNILSWAEGGCYRIANEALPEYAGKMGYLTKGLEEAKRQAISSLSAKAS